MSYGIIRVQKVKAAAVGAMQYHNDRMPGVHCNEDIDPSRTGENFELTPHRKYTDEVNNRIERFRTSDRAVRKDAVVLVEGIVTASPEFFDEADPAQRKAFFEDAYKFVSKEAGAENMVHFTVHMDETTPHAHFGFTPIKEGQLAWKQFFNGKYQLMGFQDRFYAEVSRNYGLERGERGSGRKHKDLAQMKRDQARELADIEKNIDAGQDRLEYLQQKTFDIENAIHELEAENRILGSRLKDLPGMVERTRNQCFDLEEEKEYHSWQLAILERIGGKVNDIQPWLRGKRSEECREITSVANENRAEVEGRIRSWEPEPVIAPRSPKPTPAHETEKEFSLESEAADMRAAAAALGSEGKDDRRSYHDHEDYER